MATILGALRKRVPDWTYERTEGGLHHRLTAPSGQQVIELNMQPGTLGGTVVEGWAYGWPILMRFGPDRPVDLVIDQLERWGALPQTVSAR